MSTVPVDDIQKFDNLSLGDFGDSVAKNKVIIYLTKCEPIIYIYIYIWLQ